MKRIVNMLLCVITPIIVHAQSDSLVYAYRQVCRTLEEYRFLSEDVEKSQGKTLSIKFQIKDGNYIFTFNDDFRPYHGSFFKNRHGIKVVTVPILEVEYDKSLYFGRLNIEGRNGVELLYKGKKELLRWFGIMGETLSIEKLYKELQQLHTFVVEENFMGVLDGGVASSKKVPPKNTNNTAKKAQPSAQPQQRKRNRVPFGN